LTESFCSRKAVLDAVLDLFQPRILSFFGKLPQMPADDKSGNCRAAQRIGWTFLRQFQVSQRDKCSYGPKNAKHKNDD